MHKRRIRVWMIVVAVVAGLVIYNYWPAGPEKIRISRQTTYITAPLNADGTPNYVAYLDAKAADDVTPEGNAAPLLLRALGPDLLPKETRAEALKKLGLTEDIFGHDKHFVSWGDRKRPTTKPVTATTSALTGSEDEDAAEEEDAGPSMYDVWELLRKGQMHPEIAPWLAENAAALDLLRQASKKEALYLPLISRSDPPYLPDATSRHWQLYTEAGRSLASSAMIKATDNDIPGAWEDILACHRLARLIRPSSVIDVMVAVAIDGLASMYGTRLAIQFPLAGEQARKVLKELAGLKPMPGLAASIDEGERFAALDVVMAASRGYDIEKLLQNPDPDFMPQTRRAYGLDWNRMLEGINPWYDRAVNEVGIRDAARRKQAARNFRGDLARLKLGRPGLGYLIDQVRGFFRFCGGRLSKQERTDKYANLAVFMFMSAYFRAAELYDHAKASLDVETLAVALACFHAEQGNWPARLDELCPGILPAVPKDVFSGTPMVYQLRADGYLLYNVGENLTDDGGQSDRDKQQDDIAAEVKGTKEGR